MSQIVHITFEKLTGLKGEIEGDFICDEKPDLLLPLILEACIIVRCEIVFRQSDKLFYMRPISFWQFFNYIQHFKHGTNFLIKQWSYGGGVTINSQPPN